MVGLIKNIIIVFDDVCSMMFDATINHEDKYKEYALKRGIDDKDEYRNGYNWGRFLALKGILNVQTACKNLILFLPVSLNKKQNDWLKKNKEMFLKYKTRIVNYKMENNCVIESHLSNLNDANVLKDLYNAIKEKEVINDEKSCGFSKRIRKRFKRTI